MTQKAKSPAPAPEKPGDVQPAEREADREAIAIERPIEENDFNAQST